MSSSLNRDPLSGIIRQNKKVVGAICLPEEDLLDFIDHFNHCYGPLLMYIEKPDSSLAKPAALFPVGSGRSRPILPPHSVVQRRDQTE